MNPDALIYLPDFGSGLILANFAHEPEIAGRAA